MQAAYVLLPPKTRVCNAGVDTVTFSAQEKLVNWTCSDNCSSVSTCTIVMRDQKLIGKIPATIGLLTCKDKITKM